MTFFVSPEIVGIYAIAILLITLFQSATDAAVRQVAVPALKRPDGVKFLQNYSRIIPSFGALFVTTTLIGVYFVLNPNVRDALFPLLLFALIPTITAMRVIPIAILQKQNSWRKLAQYQLLSALASFIVSVPVLIATQSLLAPALQLVLTELTFTLLARRNAPSNVQDVELEESPKQSTAREFAHLSMYSVVAWLQGQADRALIGPLAGTDKLGEYTVATSIARSAGDAISTSTANVLRPTLFTSSNRDAPDVRKASDSVLLRATLVAALSTLATILGIEFVLRPVLDPQWDSSLDAAMVLSLTTGPTLMAWCTTVVLIAAERVRWAAPVKVLGALCSIPIAFAAVESIQLAASLAVLREIIVMAIMLAIAGKYAPIKSTVAVLGLYFPLAGIVAALS